MRLGFAPSNRPHLHRAYKVTVCNQNFIAVDYIWSFFVTFFVSKLYFLLRNKEIVTSMGKFGETSGCGNLNTLGNKGDKSPKNIKFRDGDGQHFLGILPH